MRARTLLLGVASTILGGAFASMGALRSPSLPPQISVDVNVVNVPVTVTDSHGGFVSGLSRENFRLLVDGVERPIEYFAPEETPAQVLILLETGPAVYLLRGEHLAAAADFLKGLRIDDRVAVATYGNAPQLLLDFTTDKQQAAAALGIANYGIGMANLSFYSSLAVALDWASSADGKSAVVALTTGLDDSGLGSWQILEQKMQRSNAMVLPVGLGGTLREFGKGKAKSNHTEAPTGEELSFAESNRALQTIATETGGQAYFPRKAMDFEDAYRQIATLLRHQYSLGFAAGTGHGQYHTIRVEVTGARGKSYRVSARRGFLAPAR